MTTKRKNSNSAKARAKAKRKPTNGEKPEGMVAKVIALATRSQGVSRAEFMKATGWLSATPKQLIAGYAKRWGYGFKIADADDGKRYRLIEK